MPSILYLIKCGRRRRHAALCFTLTSASVVFAFFQNFSSIPIENLKLKSNRAEARANLANGEETDIRSAAPQRPVDEAPMIAVPTSGNDLESVGRDWLTKQGRLMAGGAEKKLLRDMNKKMNRWVGSVFEGEDFEEGDASHDSQKTRPTSNSSLASSRTPANNAVPSSEVESNFAPTRIGFSRINRFEMGWSNQLKVICDYGPGSMRVDLKHPVSNQFDLNLSHEATTGSNSLQLHYRW